MSLLPSIYSFVNHDDIKQIFIFIYLLYTKALSFDTHDGSKSFITKRILESYLFLVQKLNSFQYLEKYSRINKITNTRRVLIPPHYSVFPPPICIAHIFAFFITFSSSFEASGDFSVNFPYFFMFHVGKQNIKNKNNFKKYSIVEIKTTTTSNTNQKITQHFLSVFLCLHPPSHPLERLLLPPTKRTPHK